MASVAISEGFVPFSYPTIPAGIEARTWYRITGNLSSGDVPLVTLHGGPGIPSLYLYPTFDILAERTGRPVIYYDQVGCGNSTRMPDTMGDADLWTAELFVSELENLLSHLGVARYHLYGHSWGAILGAMYAISNESHAGGLGKLIIGSAPTSMSLWEQAQRTWLKGMPDSVQEAIAKAEDTKDYQSAEYQDAVMEYYKVHLCRVHPFPEPLQAALGELETDSTVYMTMDGPSEITITGTLKTFDMTASCRNIKVPTLLINGEYDEAADSCVKPWFDGIDKVKWVRMANCSHLASLEMPEKYVEIVAGFLED